MNDRDPTAPVPTLPHAGLLPDWSTTPGWILPSHDSHQPALGLYSCAFCGVGDSGVVRSDVASPTDALGELPAGEGVFSAHRDGEIVARPAVVEPGGEIVVTSGTPLCGPGGLVHGEVTVGAHRQPVTAREVDREGGVDGAPYRQRLVPFRRAISVTESAVKDVSPTTGCVKLKLSTVRQKPAFPIHASPSVLQPDGTRRAISYGAAIQRFVELLLEHRQPAAKTLVYGSGQLDYFTVFAMQEVFRLLGIRNLTGNAEHCLNAGAVHNEVLTGQEGPFLTIAQSLEGPNRMFLFNGWNGYVTHPPVFASLLKRPDLDAFLIEVMVTESAKALAQKLGPERILLIRPRSDPQLALAVGHEILERYPDAIEKRFIDRFGDSESFRQYEAYVRQPRFSAGRVAQRIAPEPKYEERIHDGIRRIAYGMAQPSAVPINIPSVGLSQTSGIVAHCLWGNVMAMLGKYGLHADGTPAGGTLRVPGQINAESEVQGLSRKYFMGRVGMEHRVDAARRMGLPDDAYEPVAADEPRAALDYSDPTDHPELMICFGTQFEANMIGRPRWLSKLEHPGTTLVVVDPIPDPYTLEHAELILPSPPHPATTKLYQNGEWKMSLSIPHKKAPPETRSDATILYDLMAEVVRRLETEPGLAGAHPDLARHLASGYLRQRFCPPSSAGEPGLVRVDGEVSRAQLWQRIQDYMQGGCGPLYCRPEHADGRPIAWEELLQGPVVYGGVGQTRFRLDYDDPEHVPFRDVFRRPGTFRFFVPTPADIEFPMGVILNSGRSTLSDDRAHILFATSTFNSGKATPLTNMPEDNPLHLSEELARRSGVKDGEHARVINRQTGEEIVLPVIVTDRVKGETAYVSFHKSHAKIHDGVCVNTVTSHEARCPYSGQTQVKATQVMIEAADAPRLDTTLLDPKADVPVWSGQQTPLYVTDIILETHDVYTFRLQGKPLCRFAYYPGQFCALVLNIDGKKVVRSYSISSPPTRPYVLEVTIKRVPGGLVSNWLPDNLKIGDRIEVSGPKGRFCLQPGKVPPKILLVGAGSGVTPMMSMARWLCDVSADVDVRFFNSVRSPRDIIYREEIEHMGARYRQFSPVVITTTREHGASWTGLEGRVSRAMLEMVAPDLHERHVYMCGPEGFMEAVKGCLKEARFDLANLHMESFGGVRTSVKRKSLPFGLEAPLTEEADDTEGPIEVEFARSGRTARTDGRMTLLDLAEAHDVPLDYACRAGSCGDCKAKLLSGEVDSETDEGLDPAEREAGYILTCVSTPKGNCVIDR